MAQEETLSLPRKPRRGDLVELSVDGLDERGAGTAHVRVCIGPGGQPRTLSYVVRRAVPGDHIQARVRRVRGGRLEASIEAFLAPSPDRTPARCQYFDSPEAGPGCGGCALQSLEYAKQLTYKAERVTALMRQVGVPEASIQPPVPARSPWYYRNKMEFSFGEDVDGTYALGMHPGGRRYDVLPLEVCYLQSEGSAALVRAIRTWGEAHGVAHHNLRHDTGLLRTLTIREGKRTDERIVELTTSPSEMALFDGVETPTEAVVASFLEALLEASAQPGCAVDGVLWTRHIAIKGQPTRIEHTHLHGSELLHETLEVEGAPPLHFDIHPRAFFQPNTLQAEVLYGEVLRATGLDQGDRTARVMDLYCGTGTIGLAMAHRAAEIIGIERSPDAVASARANAARNGISHVTFHEGDVGEVLNAEGLAKPGAVDVVVVDPPRAGLLPFALEQLKTLAAPRLVYVSCNPVALAKNLRELCDAGWDVTSLRPVDMFPQTAHIETIAVLQRTAS